MAEHLTRVTILPKPVPTPDSVVYYDSIFG